MTRANLEHIIRAAGAVADVEQVVVVGSQAVLGSFPEAPAALLRSMEADLYPLVSPERADLIDGSIGEDSFFHETFGYYAHGVGPETARLPARWMERVVRIRNANTRNVEALCLGPVDLAVSKLLAGREKDVEFVRVLVHTGIVAVAEIRAVERELGEPDQERLRQVLRLVEGE